MPTACFFLLKKNIYLSIMFLNFQNINKKIMKKYLLLLFLALNLTACEIPESLKNKEIPKSISDSFKLAPEVKIQDVANFVFIAPKNESKDISGDIPLTFLWEKPIFSLQNPQEAKKVLEKNIKIEPEIKGTWMFLGATGISFQPDSDWKDSTKYKVIFSPQINKILKYKFETQSVKITHIQSYNLVGMKPITVTFNQDILSGVKDLIEIKNTESEEIFKFFKIQYATEKDENGKNVIQKNKLNIIPLKPWEENALYQIKLLPGLWSIDGNLNLKKPYTSEFRTLPQFRVERIEVPKYHNDSISFRFSSPVKSKDFIKNIKIKPEPSKEIWEKFIKILRDESYTSKYFYLASPFKNWDPKIEYTLTLNPEIRDEFDRPLILGEENLKKTFQTTMSDRFSPIFMLDDYSVFQKETSLKPTFYYSGTYEKVRVTLYPQNIPEKEIIFDEKNNPTLENKEKIKAIKEKFSKNIKTFELKKALDQSHTLEIDLKENFPETLDPEGNFIPDEYILNIEIYKPQYGWRKYYNTHFFISEFSVELKKLSDESFKFFMKPFPQVKETKLGENFVLDLYQGNWQSQWHWKTLENFKNGEKVSMNNKELQNFKTVKVTAQNGKVGFGSTQFNKGIYAWDAKININRGFYKSDLSGKVFTDRPLYKKGQKVFFKGFIREKENFGKNFPLKNTKNIQDYDYTLTVKDGQYKELTKIKGKTSNGSFNESWNIPKDVKLGQFSFDVEIEGKQTLRLYENFWVQTYRKPKMLLFKNFDTENAVAGETLKAKIEAKYAFGGAVSGAKVDYKISLFGTSPCDFYCFGFQDSKDKLLLEGKSVLDENGEIEIPINLKDLKLKKEDIWNLLTLNATVHLGESEKSSTEISIPFYTSHYQIKLENTPYFYEAEKTVSIDGKVLDLEEKIIPNQNINATLFQTKWIRNDRKNPSGDFYGEWESVDKKISQFESTTNEKGIFKLEFKTPQKGGQYFLRLETLDKQKRKTQTETHFWISGSQQDSVKFNNKNKIINLFASKDLYKIEDEIEIFAPVPNFKITRAHATLERGEILETLEFDTKTNTVKFKPQNWMVPNIYVSMVIEGINEKGEFQVRWGAIKINIEDGLHDLEIQIKSEKPSYNPGETVKLKIKTSVKEQPHSGEVTIAVVDQTLLALKSRGKINLKKALLQSIPLGVEVYHTLANFHSLQEMKEIEAKTASVKDRMEMAFGGGGGSSSKGGGFKPRGDFKDTAYFLAKIKTDENGEGTIEFKVPDNLTTWNVLAVGATENNAFGETETDFKVSLPLLISEILPQFFQAGDTLKIGLFVHRDDASQKEKPEEKIKIKLNLPENFQNISPLEQEVLVKKEKEIFFEIKTPKTIEQNCKNKIKGCDIKISFEIQSEDKKLKDAVEREIKLIPPHSKISAGEFLNVEKEILFSLAPSAKAIQSKLKIQVLGSLKVLAKPLIEQSYRNNFGSIDQNFVEATLEMYQSELLEGDEKINFIKNHKNNWKKTKDETENAFEKNKGFKYFKDSNHASLWVTVNILENTEIWKKQDLEIDKNLISTSLNWINQAVKKRCNGYKYFCVSDSLRQEIGFLLAQNNYLTVHDLNVLNEYTSSFEAKVWWLKMSFLLPSLDPKSQEIQQKFLDILNNQTVVRDQYIFWEENARSFYSQEERLTAIILELLLKQNLYEKLQFKVSRYLAETSPRYYSNNTTLWVLKSLFKYDEKNKNPPNPLYQGEKSSNKFNIDIFDVSTQKHLRSFNKNSKAQKLLSGEITSGFDVFETSKIIDSKPKNIAIKSEKNLLTQINLEEILKSEDIEELSRGFWITKEITELNKASDISEKEISPSENIKLQQGKNYQVKLKIITRASHRNVMIESPIVSGAEIVNFNFSNSDKRLSQMSEGSRECFWGWCSPIFDQKEFYEDKALFFMEYLPAGTYEINYVISTRLKGDFQSLPTTIKEIYYPEIFAQTKGEKIIIE